MGDEPVGAEAQLAAEVGRLVADSGPPSARSLTTTRHRASLRATYGCETVTATECRRAPAGLLPRPAHGLVRGRLFGRPAPRAAWGRALAVFDLVRLAGQTHELKVLALGGAASDPARTDTAYVHRDALYDVNFLSVANDSPVTAEAERAARRWADAGFAARRPPHADGGAYQNFVDPALRCRRHAYYAENCPRLTGLQAAYDPRGAFRFPQGVGRGTPPRLKAATRGPGAAP
ncbi:hypothetical protein ADL30_35495 [Streptomyces sp. NRRL S-1521]|nr:hypothetical protein ADL30_35495 [Streptomyces sp. NRRL S-1521]